MTKLVRSKERRKTNEECNDEIGTKRSEVSEAGSERKMKKSNIGTIAGAVSSVAYFRLSESTVPKESNCSYLAPVSTDVLANLGALALLWRAQKTDDPYVAFMGACILGIHTQQWINHKTKQKSQSK